MVQYIKTYKKNIAMDMRQRGFSYSEIEKSTHIPKATLSLWLRDIKLTQEQIQKLHDKRLNIAKANSQKRISKTAQLVEEIKASSALDIQKISKRELWLMGVILYWRSESIHNLHKGVNFTSSDPYLIKLFLKWLKDIGGIQAEEMAFDIFVSENQRDLINKIIDHWSDVTGFAKDKFSHIYFQKPKKKSKKDGRVITQKNNLGLLKIRVKASSMLARQISGWIMGIQQYYGLYSQS